MKEVKSEERRVKNSFAKLIIKFIAQSSKLNVKEFKVQSK